MSDTPDVDIDQMTPEAIAHLDADALDQTWYGSIVVLKKSKAVGHDSTGRVYYLSYSPNDSNPGGAVCNRLHGAGTICRLPRNHVEEYGIPHMEFDANLVVSSGIYVVQLGPPPESEPT